ncbi:MAG: arsenite methyltransferase [Gemmatimonadetes bacterium]|nr:arsenite methyltransferase [Gemmatimonadota bacterium]NNM03849.1 arsenite methyltransferase [Gemmatimonadota bacterium]
MKEDDIRRAVRDRYGSIAREGSVGCGCGCSTDGEGLTDLATIGQTVGYSKDQLNILPEGTNLGLGCGNPTALASLKEGETVLDLGSGGGIDCFLASKEVGPDGRVIGVDMTPDMIERARKAAKAGGYANVEFRLGEIEALPVPDNSVDAVISNCVLNLSPARDRVFKEVVRVLKPGGRIMISDLISVHPTPQFLLENTDALVGCLPVQEDEYLGELRASGLENVEIVEEKAYPNDLLTADPAVRDYLASHPAQEEIILSFIGSIRSGMIQGVKPI